MNPERLFFKLKDVLKFFKLFLRSNVFLAFLKQYFYKQVIKISTYEKQIN